ncbi:MAG: MATE family efflux transporter [Deltaproteobacteria bacterium]|nr:MATE family efflux transporter [Deltaproteobacteria bacterium]
MLSLALPLALAGISTPVLSLVETAVVGHLPGSHNLGAVAIGTTVFNYVYWAFSFLRMSTTALTAQAVGADRPDEVRASFARALLVALALGVTLVALGGPLRWLAFTLLPVSEQVRARADEYVAIRLWSAPAAFVSYALLGFFMGLSRPRLAMVMEVLRGVVYVPLAFVLVKRLEGGVAGVATASVAAEWTAVLVSGGVAWALLARLPSRSSHGALGAPPEDRAPVSRAAWWRRAVLDRRALWRLFAINRDLFVRTQCLLVVFATFAARGAAMGDDTLAANAVLMSLYLLVAYGLGAFAQAASALVGTAVGAGERVGLWRAVRTTTAWAVGVAAASSLVLAALGERFLAMLTDAPAIRELAATYLPHAAALPVVAVLSFQLDGAAIGATRTVLLRNVLLVALASYAVAHVTLVPLVGNHGLWLSFSTFMLVRSAGFFLFVRALRRDGER